MNSSSAGDVPTDLGAIAEAPHLPSDLIRIKWRAPRLSFNSAMQTIRQPLPPEEARREELARALRRLEAGIAPQQVMDEMTRRLAAKLLHAHTVALEAELL